MTARTCAVLCGLALISCGEQPVPRLSEAPPSITSGFVEVEGGRLYYEELGTGDPVVLVHSADTDLRLWDDQFEIIAAQYRTVRYDLRGFGRSESGMVEFTDHEDLRALLDHLGIERTTIVGASLGGMAATDFSLEYPERVARLVLAGTGLTGYESVYPEEMWDLYQTYLDFREAGDLEAMFEIDAGFTFGAQGRPYADADPVVVDRYKTMVLHNWESDLRDRLQEEELWQRREPDAIEVLHNIEAPILLLLGEYESPNEYGIADLYEANASETQRMIIPGAKHLTSMENPEAFNRALLAFLSSQ